MRKLRGPASGRRRSGLCTGFCLGALACGAAHAQNIEGPLLGSEIPVSNSRGRNVSVQERAHPEYDSAGLRTGGFTLFPRLTTGVGFAGNVLATRDGARSDGFAVIEPGLTARSDWSRHSLVVSAGATLREFFAFSRQNQEGAFVNADARVDVTRDSRIEAGGQVQRVFQARDFGDFPGGADTPIPIVESRLYARFVHDGGRVRLIAASDLAAFRFEDVPAIGGGILREEDRDYMVARTSD